MHRAGFRRFFFALGASSSVTVDEHKDTIDDNIHSGDSSDFASDGVQKLLTWKTAQCTPW